jgi:hypothetical protein
MGSYYQPANYLKSNRGGGSYYQPKNYLSGGKLSKTKTKGRSRRVKKHRGGFYPSIMGGVMSAGKFLVAASLRQGYNMITSKPNRKSKTRKLR